MSKAEERVLEKYPIEMYEDVGWRCVDKNADKRKYFIEGYHQAEKDLELTWQDVANIDEVISEILKECGENILYNTQEDFYKEVLKRFKESNVSINNT